MSRSQRFYGTIDGIEPAVGAACWVRLTAERLSPVITTMNGGTTPLLPGYRIKILDGNHLPGSEHRIGRGPWGPPLCRGTPWSYSTPS